MNRKSILLFGRSGSGKGTQAELLEKYLKENDPERDVIYIETGSGIRKIAENSGTLTGKLVKDILDKGGLMPEFLPIWVWANFFVNNYTGNEHVILDGLARRLPEAPVLESALQFYKQVEGTTVIHLVTSKDWSCERLLARGRSDDNKEDIMARLEWFDDNVVSSIEYFKKNKDFHFVEINGEQSIENVHKDIINSLK